MLSTKLARRRSGTGRDPEGTRKRLLQAAFGEVYKSGFQAADLDTILKSAGVTKGALYHHFENKEALGYAIVDEVIAGITREKWLVPLKDAPDPLNALAKIFQSTSLRLEDVAGGCPLNNLSQEMSPIHEGFRKRLSRVFGIWHDAIAEALRNGQRRGIIKKNVDVDETATFLIAAYEGYLSLAKNGQDAKILKIGNRGIVNYLATLRN